MHYMALGGAESALLGLLQSNCPDKADIDLFLYDHRGELMHFIPDDVMLLPPIEAYSMIERPLREIIKKKYWGIALGRIVASFFANLERRNNTNGLDDICAYYYIAKFVAPFLPNINPEVEYDLAISFITPHNIVLSKVKSKKKIAWIHTDYSAIHVNVDKELPIWDGYDYIASISPDCKRSFLKLFPSLERKIIDIENILSPEFVRQQAELFDVSDEMTSDGLKLLSVGRYTQAKNYENVPDIARRIVNAGYSDLRWYIIGFGGLESLIRQKIAEAGMENHVILLGKKDNPYPYIKACDIYVQPSRYEGKSVTVREAQILYKPVIVTNYSTAGSQIQDGIDGVIVPLDNEACANGIINVVENKELLNSISAWLSTHDYGNESEVEKIYNLF